MGGIKYWRSVHRLTPIFCLWSLETGYLVNSCQSLIIFIVQIQLLLKDVSRMGGGLKYWRSWNLIHLPFVFLRKVKYFYLLKSRFNLSCAFSNRPAFESGKINLHFKRRVYVKLTILLPRTVSLKCLRCQLDGSTLSNEPYSGVKDAYILK